MRAFLRFLIVVLITAVAACSGRGTSTLPATTPVSPLAAGPVATGPSQQAAAVAIATPVLTAASRLLDNGAIGVVAPAATYVGFRVSATDSRSAANSAADFGGSSFAAPAEPSSAADTGSHAVTITGISSTQAFVTSNQVYDLTYAAGGRTYGFSDLIAHLAVSGTALPTAISAEYVSGSGAATFDIRMPCSSNAAPGATLSRFSCPIPASGTASIAQMTNAVVPGAAGTFAPAAAKIYFVLTYATVPAMHSSTLLNIDNVYLAQCGGAGCAATRQVSAAVRAVASQPTAGWPALGQNNQHTAYVNDPQMNSSVASRLGVNWMASIFTADLGSPVAALDTALNQTLVYAGNERGDVFAVNEANGSPVYSTSLGVGNALRSTPLVTNGSLFIGTNFNPMLWKLDAATGKQQCRYKQTFQIQASPTAATPPGGVATVYDAAIDGATLPGPWFAVNEANCAQIFSFTSYRTHSGPWASTAYGVTAAGRGVVTVGTSDPDTTFYEIDANTGALLWEFRAANPAPYSYDIGAAATVSLPGVNGFADGVVYFPTKYGIMYALDLTTGKEIWEYNFNKDAGVVEGGRSSAALDGNKLVFGYNGGMYALNATTGAKLWKYQDPTNTEILASPAVVGPAGAEVVAAGDVTGAFHVVRLSDGVELYHYQTGGFISASPAYINGHFLVTSSDGFIYDFAVGGSNAAPPATVITYPTQGSTVPNPGASLVLTGTASDATSVIGVDVTVQAGAPAGSWYNAATKSYNSAPVSNFVPVANPGSPSSTWKFTLPVAAHGATYSVYASAVNGGHQNDVKGTVSVFTVDPSSSSPTVKLSTPYIVPGGSLSATAAGFAPNEVVTFNLVGAMLTSGTTDSTGTVTVPLTIPTTAPLGPSTIVAIGQTSNKRSSAAINVTNAWVEFGYGPNHTYFEPNDNIFQHVLSVYHGTDFLKQAWYAPAGDLVDSSPALLNGVMYFGNNSGVVTAVNASTGIPVWTYQTINSAPITTGPAIDVATGFLLVTCDDGNMYKLNPTNGSLIATIALGGKLTSPAINNQKAFVSSDNGTLYSVDENSNAIVWKTKLGGAIHSSPAVDSVNGLVVVGDDSGAISAFAIGTGTKRWSMLTKGAVTASPTIQDNVVFIGSTDGTLYALNVSTGATVWTAATGSPIHANVAIDTVVHYVYVGMDNGLFLGFTPAGKQLFKNASSTSPIVSLAAAHSVVLGERAGGIVNVFRPDQLGATLWTFQTRAGLKSTPTVVNGSVFVGAEDGGVYAFTPYGKPPPRALQSPLPAGAAVTK